MGLFITFEGIDGSGKTTHLKLLYEHLLQKGIGVVWAREPGGTKVGESIRQILLHSKTTGLRPVSELLLYYASRHQNLFDNILPALEKGSWVLCDRFADASMAYQGYGRGIDLELIRQLNHLVIDQHEPDLTILMDVEPALGLARARRRNQKGTVDEGRFEKESLQFFERVRQGYLALARENPQRVRMVDGDQPVEAVHLNILQLLSPYGVS
jgi:dTMP kinase